MGKLVVGFSGERWRSGGERRGSRKEDACVRAFSSRDLC